MKSILFQKTILFCLTFIATLGIFQNLKAQQGYSSSSVMMNRSHSNSPSHSSRTPRNTNYHNRSNHGHPVSSPASSHTHHGNSTTYYDNKNNYNYNAYQNPTNGYKQAGITASDQVVVEEYMNYHTHQIKRAKGSSPLALDLSWSSNEFINDGSVLQIGLASKEFQHLGKMNPLNISVVIDQSGSMATDNKMHKVKTALREFVKGLRPEDRISIVTYSTRAHVAFSGEVNNHSMSHIQDVISRISPNGSTNLNEGMEYGYEEVLRNYSDEYTNRVILLTDGIANVGTTTPSQIVSNSFRYNQKGISISTIGVGKDLNYQLLSNISKKGKGSNYFIGSHQEDIQKVFKDELQSLLSPIARNVKLVIEYPENMRVSNFMGYQPRHYANRTEIDLNNINSGLTQVFLMKFSGSTPNMEMAEGAIKVSLEYYDIKQRENTSMTETIALNPATSNYHHWDNQEVKKNYMIAYMAQELKRMALENENSHYAVGQHILNSCISYVEGEFPGIQDNDVRRIYDILKGNQTRMDTFCQHYHIQE